MRSALIVLFTLALVLRAQTPLGTVTGLAADPSGGAVPGVALTLTSQETGVKRTASTNGAGLYSFPDLPPGTYRLNADASGFRPVETRPFAVEAFRTVRQDLPLELATANSAVIVTEAASPVIQVDTPAIATSLASRQIIELPTTMRSVAKNSGDSGLISEILPETVPGVVQVGGGAKWLTPGGTAGATDVKVDGIETRFGNFGSPDNVSQPSMEAIQEFTANVLTARAEFAGMGTITTATKSGTNEFHGGVYEYMHNSVTDARNTFATALPFTNLHNYGGTLGGPVQKDKTFFFVDFDGTRGVSAYLFSPNVPTVAMRNGDFSSQAALKNPFSGFNPYSGNTILPQYLSPQAKQVQQTFFPLPNFGPPSLTAANYRASFNGPEVHRTEEFRVDHNFSANHMAFVRYSNRKDDYQIPGARSSLPPTTIGTSDNIRRVNFWTFGDVANLRPTVVNEFRAGVVILVSASSADFTGQNLLQQIGIAGLPDRGAVNSLPFFNVSGFTNNNINLFSPVNDGHAQFADNLSWVHGRHSMKFGVEAIDWFVNRYMPNNSGNPIFGSYAFTGAFTGNAYADFLLGVPATVTRVEPFPAQYNRSRDWSGYAQDDFKVTSQADPDLRPALRIQRPGLRQRGQYVLFRPGHRQNRGADPGVHPEVQRAVPIHVSGGDRRPAGLGRSLRQSDKNNFAPRFGFSYQLGKDARDGTARRLGHLLFPLFGECTRRSGGRSVRRHHHQHQHIHQRPAAVHAGQSVRGRGHPGYAHPARRGAQSAQQLGAAVHAFAGARIHARYGRARELHRLQGNANWSTAAT